MMKMRFLFVFQIIILHVFGFVSTQQFKYITIGGIFPENSQKLVNSFENAARLMNIRSQTLKLKTTFTQVDTNDSFKVQKAVCDMIDNNVAAIFGPNSPKTTSLVASICKKLQIPHFTAIWQPIEIDNFNSTDSYTRNLYPHPKKYSVALMEIVKSFRWLKFAIIYDSDDSLEKLQYTFNDFSRVDISDKQSVSFYKLPMDTDDYKPMLKSISKSGINQIMIDCTVEHTYSILKQSINVSMMNEYVSFFLFGNDAYTLDLTPLPDVNANITTIRFINPTNADVYEYQIQPPYYGRDRYYKSMFNPNEMTTEAALIHDAVIVFATAFGDNATFIYQFNMNPTSCYNIMPNDDDGQEATSSGRDILTKVDENTILTGLTDGIRFDSDGLRDLFYIEMLQFMRNETDFYKKIALYDSRNGITLLSNFSNVDEQTALSMQAKIFKVIVRPGMPFVRKIKNIEILPNMTENDLYEGFALDLIREIAIECKFRYEVIVKDIENGKLQNGQWTGIVKEIIDKRADFAIGDITLTQARKSVIDFSAPFKTLGISILYAKPHKEKAGFFSFMAPLSPRVWMHMATAFLCISITEFLLAKQVTHTFSILKIS